ncbi:hypothetical protein K2173_015433 [Erythroxylum novogranatense]|uniref:Brix domain-containing protein n=1 Tax=Erythroxylum novogranatense TaxID=1862640 RepID=A0AAV8SSE0_9ROSI|nr:hypothetical protein K2173_015433 [Erythroxylum novogranatense]
MRKLRKNKEKEIEIINTCIQIDITLNKLHALLKCYCRKHKDLYLCMAKWVHTMEELKLTGNHLKESRPILTFSIFGTPKGNMESKPYHDHVFIFSIVDNLIWFRNYQVYGLDQNNTFGGSFGGLTLYENPFYGSPNQIRSLEKKQKAGKFAKKVKAKTKRKMHELSNPLELDELADLWKD